MISSTGERSCTFTATPPASERLGNPEMDNSLFNNPWADEDQQLEATVHQPAPAWNLQNCLFCGKEEDIHLCSGCGGFLETVLNVSQQCLDDRGIWLQVDWAIGVRKMECGSKTRIEKGLKVHVHKMHTPAQNILISMRKALRIASFRNCSTARLAGKAGYAALAMVNGNYYH